MKGFISFQKNKQEDERSYSLSRFAWDNFKSDKMAMGALVCIVLVSLMAIFAYLFIPDTSPHANRQVLEIAGKRPGFKVDMLKLAKNQPEREQGWIEALFLGCPDEDYYLPINKIDYRFPEVQLEYYSGWEGEAGKLAVYSMADIISPLALDAPLELQGDSLYYLDVYGNVRVLTEQEAAKRIGEEQLVQKRFMLGTDPMGRDFFSRLVLGARVSLSVGLISVVISIVIGITIGLIGGYFGGKVDGFIMWLINVVWSMPTLLLVIAITFVLGKGFWQVFIAVGLTMWVEVARVVRGQVMGVKEKEYIDAARVLGYSSLRILFRHILPNVLAPVIVISAANFASAILLEAGLSFLGIGVQPPMPSWGSMVKDYYGYLLLDKAYLAILPGMCIMLLVMSFMLLGNGLRDALDTKKIK